MGNVTITIDDWQIEATEGMTILQAAKEADIYIPTLCYHPDLNVRANCRICVVEVEGLNAPVTACSTPVKDGMKVKTNTKMLRSLRRNVLKLLLASHQGDCTTCVKNGKCELQDLAARFGITHNEFEKISARSIYDDSTPSLIRDSSKCIKCGRCVEMCQNVQKVGILFQSFRSHDVIFSTEYSKPLADVSCILCGQCSNVCPVGAIYEKSDIEKVWSAIYDDRKHVIVQTAPAIRVSIGEIFDLKPGTITTGKLVSALRKLGFDRVFDTDFAADLTIVEEGNELLHRLSNNGVLPMITSCSPGWINYCEHYYPELLDHLSTCKSPQQMFGALAKTYYAQKFNLNPEDIFVVSIMPCTAKKYEAQRPEMRSSGYRDVDVVLTTRELGAMFREAYINFEKLPESEFDAPLGISTGAGAIFGATGGVMEAALRTVYEVVTGKTLDKLDFNDVRGMEGIKEAEVEINGINVNVAVAHGIANAKILLDQIKEGRCKYQFIEIMACPGGCIGGGGQPYGTTNEIRQQRIQGLYEVDKNMPLRKSHENPAVKALYEEFLIKPLGEKSHSLLHTHYTPRTK